MSNLSVFNFESKEVRVLLDDTNTPMFVAVDVCNALGYNTPRDAIARHCKGVAKHDSLQTTGGKQKVRVIYEPDVYRLIFGSKLESAVQFQNWVFEEVLPTIRKTGSYMLTISTEQQHAIKEAVHQKVARDRKSHQAVYREFYNHFGIPRYQELPAAKFDEAMAWLNAGAKPEEPKVHPNQSYFLSYSGAHEFDARLKSMYDLIRLFEKQAREMNEFCAREGQKNLRYLQQNA